jgi:hypothetical protein
MPADVLILTVGAAVAAVVVLVALTSADARQGLALVVGITGGLQTAQIGRVHVFCFAVVAWLVLGRFREGFRPFRAGAQLLPPICAAVLALTVVTGSLVNTTSVAVQLMLLATTATVFAVFADERDLRAVLTGLLLVTTYASVVGLLQYGGVLPHELFEGENRPIGIYLEPDWLGMFSAIGLLLSFYVRRPALRYPAAAVNLGAVLLAAARAAWIAVLVVAVVGVLFARLAPATQRPRGAWRLTAFAALAGVVLVAAVPELATLLATRLAGVSTSAPDVSALARQQQLASLQHLEAISPWNGLGLSASGRVGVSGLITYTGQADNNVASNWILGWWVDGKLLAIPLIALILGLAAVRVGHISGRVLLVVVVSSLFSNAMYIPIAWLAVGACLVAQRRVHGVDDGQSAERVDPEKDRHDVDDLHLAARAPSGEKL